MLFYLFTNYNYYVNYLSKKKIKIKNYFVFLKLISKNI